MESENSGSLSSQVQEEIESLKELYLTTSKELENWQDSECLVCCSDEKFDELIKFLTPKDLQGAVLIFQRQIDIEKQIVNCLESLSCTGADSDATKKLVGHQGRLAVLRSRVLRCLTKQLQDHGNKECELPPWKSPSFVIKSPSSSTDEAINSCNDTSEYGSKDRHANISSVQENPGSHTNTVQGEVTPAQDAAGGSSESVEGNRDTQKGNSNGTMSSTSTQAFPAALNETPLSGAVQTSENTSIHDKEMTSEEGNSTSVANTQVPPGDGLDQEQNDEAKAVSDANESADASLLSTGLQFNPSLAKEITLESSTPPQSEEITTKSDERAAAIKDTVDLREMSVVLQKAAAENRKSYQEWKLKRQQSEEKPVDGSTSPPIKPLPYRGGSYKKAMEKEMRGLGLKEEDATKVEVAEDQPDAVIKERVDFQSWDPTPLLRDLFGQLKRVNAAEPGQSGQAMPNVRMAGYMDKLPSSYKQKKSSIFKSWKRRHFKAFGGKLYYYEDHRCAEPLGIIELKDCSVLINGKMIEIIEKDGSAVLKVRCASSTEAEDWKEAIAEESASNAVDSPGSSLADSVIIIDLGSSSVKAGFAQEEAWPQSIFPCVCAVHKEDDSNRMYGFQAFEPQRRKNSKLVFPLRRTFKIDKLKFSTSDLIGILEHAFLSLKVDPVKHKVIMTIPQNTGLQEKEELVEILLGYFRVQAVYLQEQSILAMYSYSAVSGIVVDVGDHIDVIPVVEGCIIESGATRLPYGGRQVTDTLARHLTEKGHRFFSEVETYVARLIKEQACYVSEQRVTDGTDEIHSTDVNLAKYNLPDGTIKVSLDTARYRCTEGLFEPRHWGKDHLGIHELVYKAIQACAMDIRKQMGRSIYLSGGGSMIPGFAERLQFEVSSMLPQSSHAQVHAGTDRHHAAFIGASVVARLPIFDQLCVSQEEWEQVGPDALEKWQNL